MKFLKATVVMVAIQAIIPFLSAGQTKGNVWVFYDDWCMGSDVQWTLTRAYYISTKTFGHLIAPGQALGNVTHVVMFHSSDIVDSAIYPYYALLKEYADSGGTSTDSVNAMYNGVANPQSGLSAWTTRGTMHDLRDSLHAYGKKLLMCVQAVNAKEFCAVLRDSVKTQVLCEAIWRYNLYHNLDGMCLNIENNITFTDDQFVRFWRILYNTRPAGQLITAVPPPTQWPKYANCLQYMDYIVPQFYSFVSNWQVNPTCSGAAANGVFLKAPLHHNGTPAGSNHQDLTTWGPLQWFQNGWDKSKVVILLSNEANPFNTGDTLFSCAGNTTRFWPDTLALFMLKHGGVDSWSDNVGNYIHGTSDTTFSYTGLTISSGGKFIIPYLSNRNIDSVVAWGLLNGFTNFGLYDVSTGTRTPDLTNQEPRLARMSQLIGAWNAQITHALGTSTKSLAFGSVKVGTSKDTTFSIYNLGVDTLSLGSITSSNPVFTLRGLSSQSVFPLGAATDTVRFTPAAEGVVNAVVVINSSANSSPDTIHVTGTGTPANGVADDASELPKVYSLSQNYPNPFNPTTTIRFALPTRSRVQLRIYNVLGQMVQRLADNEMGAGYYAIPWEATVASGIYFYRIEAISTSNPGVKFESVRKMLLLK